MVGWTCLSASRSDVPEKISNLFEKLFFAFQLDPMAALAKHMHFRSFQMLVHSNGNRQRDHLVLPTVQDKDGYIDRVQLLEGDTFDHPRTLDVLLVAGLLSLFPLYWLFLTSLSPAQYVVKVPPEKVAGRCPEATEVAAAAAG